MELHDRGSTRSNSGRSMCRCARLMSRWRSFGRWIGFSQSRMRSRNAYASRHAVPSNCPRRSWRKPSRAPWFPRRQNSHDSTRERMKRRSSCLNAFARLTRTRPARRSERRDRGRRLPRETAGKLVAILEGCDVTTSGIAFRVRYFGCRGGVTVPRVLQRLPTAK
jgi:hypothetical protein